jgi:hypothetical protein
MIAMDEYLVVSESPADHTETFPRTLRGLEDAISEAAILSIGGAARKVMAGEKVIRRYEDGRETGLTLAAPAQFRQPLFDLGRPQNGHARLVLLNDAEHRRVADWRQIPRVQPNVHFPAARH